MGLGLGLSSNTLEVIRMDNQGYCGSCYTAMLEKWLRNDPSPTWSVLAEALRSPAVGLSHLAEELPTQ